MQFQPINIQSLDELMLKEYLHRNDGVHIVNAITTTGIRQALHSKLPEIGPLPAHISMKVVEAAIMQAQGLINPIDKLDQQLMKVIASDIIIDFPMLNIEEVLLCLRCGARGDYGSHNNRFNFQIITNWFTAYYNHRKEFLRLEELRK